MTSRTHPQQLNPQQSKSAEPVKTLKAKNFVVAVLLVVFTSTTPAAAVESSEEFAKLEQQFQQAKTTDQFKAVATGYDALTKQDSPSVSVLFNQANAWFEAEELGRAIVGYRQALRLTPNDAAIRSNLALALTETGQEPNRPTFVDSAFFWNGYFTTSALATLITVVMVIAASLFLLNGNSSITKIALRILTAVTLVLIASFALKISDEERTIHGAVVADFSDAKKGPAASYESAFSSPLSDGQEFTVQSQQQDWIQVDISGIGSGWMPESDVVLY